MWIKQLGEDDNGYDSAGMMMMMVMIVMMVMMLVTFGIVDDGQINFADFCKLMKQQQQHQAPGDETRLTEQDTRQVFRVSI